MQEHLRRRFILFSVMVISSILIILGIVIYMGPNTKLSAAQILLSIFIVVGLVSAGSYLLSKAAIRPIQNAWQKQLDFTADASHELRTPLAVIQTNLELVMDSPEESVESQMKWLKNIEAENKRMAKLVADLLTLSRADTNQQNVEKDMFMLDEAIMEALFPLKPYAEKKGIELKSDIQEHIAFYGDKKCLMQLVIILADNALKYTDEAGSVAISLKRTEREIALVVSDTGYGMEDEHLDKIFSRFYRITKTRGFNPDGSGLGLSIARWIVHEHGGRIEVESIVDRGTTFQVLLPNAVAKQTNLF